MAVTTVRAYQGELSNTIDTVLYTAPAGTRTRILTVTAVETTGATPTATFHVVPSGGSLSDATMLLNVQPFTANQSQRLEQLEGHNLLPGDTIRGGASAATQVTVTISAVEFS